MRVNRYHVVDTPGDFRSPGVFYCSGVFEQSHRLLCPSHSQDRIGLSCGLKVNDDA